MKLHKLLTTVFFLVLYLASTCFQISVTGDWHGTDSTKIGVYRNGHGFLDMNSNGAWDGCTTDACFLSFGGLAEDKPVAGKW